MLSLSRKNILITGGMGFLGSNLAIRLVNMGANVVIVDSMISEYGGNLFNINPIKNKVKVNYCDITDKNAMEHVIREQDYIFHLAGQVSHIMSLTDPFPDIDYNITGTAILLEACRKHNQDVRIIFSGTRGQYGTSDKLPASEISPTNPRGIYELTNLTAERMFQIYFQIFGIKTVLTRITNIYGPRAQMKNDKYGVINWFIRQIIDNKKIHLFGDGSIKRDLVYVDDCVEALIRLAQNEQCYGQVFNIGDDKPLSFKEIAETMVRVSKKGGYIFTPFSEERAKQEPGDFYSDISKIYTYVSWKPKTKFIKGLKATFDYYSKYKKHYW